MYCTLNITSYYGDCVTGGGVANRQVINVTAVRVSFKGGQGGAFAPLGSDLPPLEILFHMSVLMLWIKNNSLALSSKSYDFGVVRIKHSIAAGGAAPPRPPASEMYLVYLATKTVCIYKMYIQNVCTMGSRDMYSWFDQ